MMDLIGRSLFTFTLIFVAYCGLVLIIDLTKDK